MKKVFTWAIFILFLGRIDANCPPEIFYPNPVNLDQLECPDRFLAKKYAPILIQFANISYPQGAYGKCDVPVKVNYDGDWDHFNNWQNADDIDMNSPAAYYATLWTEGFWIITYTYYYARDYAKQGLLGGHVTACENRDWHEGDAARVVVIVDRNNGRIRGYTTSHHGNKDIVTCVDYEDELSLFTVEDDGTVPLYDIGEHPLVYSSAGSHAIYYHGAIAWNDNADGANPCNPDIERVFAFVPGALQATSSDSFEPPHDEIDYPYTNLDDYPLRVRTYELIDVFESGGLWSQRNNSNLFGELKIEPPNIKQNFACDDYCGESMTSASAPWNGDEGANPLSFINEEIPILDCDCTIENPIPSCTEIEFHECEYAYNRYFCGSYDIETPSHFDYNGSWVSNPHESGGDLYVVFTFSAFDGYTGTPNDVDWNWTVPSGTIVSCSGCNDNPANRITLRLTNTTKNDVKNNPGGYRISAEVDFIECGTITKEASFQNAIDNLINQGGGCEKLVLEINDDFHIEGNQYDWSFPLYDALATISTDGRRVEFDTETVLQQTSETTNPDSVLAYHLKVTNPAYTDSIEIDSSMKIPDCQYDGGLSLVVFPNPTSDNIFVKIRGMEEPATDLEFVIFDHQFNQVSKQPYSTEGQNTVSVARLQGGIYYLYAITGQGKTLCEKFCVVGH